MKFKIFNSNSTEDLEKQINDWLPTLPARDAIRHTQLAAYEELGKRKQIIMTVWYAD